tara:strand:+ start:10512 stop:11060 length:549 start_codon:yes stop_codon:yes gene_type:complete
VSCNLSTGRAVPCKDVVGGIQKVFFVDFGGLGDVTLTADEITDADGTFTAYEYALKGGSSLEQTITSSRETGTTFFEQVLTLNLTKLSKEDNVQIKLLAYGRPQVAVVDNNGNAFLMGLYFGAEVTGGTVATGAGMADLSGYSLTLTAQEALPANFINGATLANPFVGLPAATSTIAIGSNS